MQINLDSLDYDNVQVFLVYGGFPLLEKFGCQKTNFIVNKNIFGNKFCNYSWDVCVNFISLCKSSWHYKCIISRCTHAGGISINTPWSSYPGCLIVCNLHLRTTGSPSVRCQVCFHHSSINTSSIEYLYVIIVVIYHVRCEYYLITIFSVLAAGRKKFS